MYRHNRLGDLEHSLGENYTTPSLLFQQAEKIKDSVLRQGMLEILNQTSNDRNDLLNKEKKVRLACLYDQAKTENESSFAQEVFKLLYQRKIEDVTIPEIEDLEVRLKKQADISFFGEKLTSQIEEAARVMDLSVTKKAELKKKSLAAIKELQAESRQLVEMVSEENTHLLLSEIVEIDERIKALKKISSEEELEQEVSYISARIESLKIAEKRKQKQQAKDAQATKRRVMSPSEQARVLSGNFRSVSHKEGAKKKGSGGDNGSGNGGDEPPEEPPSDNKEPARSLESRFDFSDDPWLNQVEETERKEREANEQIRAGARQREQKEVEASPVVTEAKEPIKEVKPEIITGLARRQPVTHAAENGSRFSEKEKAKLDQVLKVRTEQLWPKITATMINSNNLEGLKRIVADEIVFFSLEHTARNAGILNGRDQSEFFILASKLTDVVARKIWGLMISDIIERAAKIELSWWEKLKNNFESQERLKKRRAVETSTAFNSENIGNLLVQEMNQQLQKVKPVANVPNQKKQATHSVPPKQRPFSEPTNGPLKKVQNIEIPLPVVSEEINTSPTLLTSQATEEPSVIVQTDGVPVEERRLDKEKQNIAMEKAVALKSKKPLLKRLINGVTALSLLLMAGVGGDTKKDNYDTFKPPKPPTPTKKEPGVAPAKRTIYQEQLAAAKKVGSDLSPVGRSRAGQIEVEEETPKDSRRIIESRKVERGDTFYGTVDKLLKLHPDILEKFKEQHPAFKNALGAFKVRAAQANEDSHLIRPGDRIELTADGDVRLVRH